MTKNELIDKMIADIMEDFDFKKVHKVMSMLGWNWGIGNYEMAVPSVRLLTKEAERLLREAAEHFDTKETWTVGSGGFEASAFDGALTLQFVLTETSAFNDDYE